MADAPDLTEPASVVTVQVDVDRCIWKYINKSAEYQIKVDAIGKEYEVSVGDTDAESSECVKLSVSGSGERASDAGAALVRLVAECQQTVSTYTIQGQDQETCSTVSENSSMLDDKGSALVDEDSAAGIIRLTGTKDEIKHALGFLEILGVAIPAPSELPLPVQTTAAVDEAPPPSLQLWKEQEGDLEEDNIYDPQQNGSPAAVVVDAKLWKYLQKSNSQWVAQITDVREMGIVITESLTADGAVSLTFTGIEDDVVKATERMRQLVERCQDVVQTVDVVCPESAVHAKVLKFLSHISKLPAYVVVESDERLTATGTSVELDECANKLAKLGASLARVNRDHPTSTGRREMTSDDEPFPNSPWLDLGGEASSGVKPDLEEDERIARQLQEQDDAESHGHMVATRVSRPADDGGEEGRQYGEIPVPIEDALWSFVEKRRASQLQQLREAYMVKISSYPAAQEGFVVIAIEAESALMLECAQDELIQLLENLRGSIVVQILQTGDEEGGRARQMPPEIGQLFSQLAEGTDAVIEVKSNNISITGPERAVGECQQKIAAFVQQVQQGEGMGGGGGGGRGMRLGGGRGRGMDLPSDMSDAEMARYMRSQGMQLPGARGGPADMISAAMGGGGGRGGGPGEYGGFFGMPTGASSFAPFASQNEFGMRREPQRGAGGGGMWPPEQRPTGGLDMLGVGGPMTQGMFDSGGRDGDAGLGPFGRTAGAGADMFSVGHPPTLPAQQKSQQQQPQPLPSMEKSADENRVSQESKLRSVRFADEEPAQQLKPAAVASTNVHELREEAKMCSVCQHSERDGEPCKHAFCVSCVQQYFSDGQHHCPVCGTDDDKSPGAPANATQPADGVMMVTYDNAFRLPGYETTSRGTIIVCYSFPPGVQKDSQPNPGRKYNGISYTAFFPLSTEGSRIVDLLQTAFDERQLFALLPTSDGKSEEITWSGVHHKTNIYGGPKICGYPDPVYLKRVSHELHKKGFH